MNHDALKDNVFALYDGELDGALKGETERHLAACLECRQMVERWTKTSKALFQASKPAGSEFFVRQVMTKIHDVKSQAPAKRWSISLPWLVPAVGMAFVLLLALMPSPQAFYMENLMFQETSGNLTWAYANHSPNSDETLQFIMGEQQ